MYVPVGQRGQGSGSGIAQQQVVAQQGGGMAAAIRAADASLQAKKKEAQRQYENAQMMMRTDLNAVAAFDVTKAGPDKAKALTSMANDISEQIKEMNNPVEARALIAKFRQYYNSGVAREALKTEASEDARSRVGADGKTLESLNSGLPVGMEYDDVDVSWLANADAAWNKEYVYQGGEIYVKGPDGNLVREDEADFLQDTSMYEVGAHSVDVGSLGDWAQSNATKTAIGFKNGTWDESRARNYYRDNVLLEEKAGKEHRLQLLTTMEDRGLTAHLTEEEKQQFRDGINLGSEKFSEIIQKGEDEFVNRSQFDGIVGGSTKKGSGKGSGDATDDENVVLGGMSIPKQTASESVKNMDESRREEFGTWLARTGGEMGHTLNRFVKAPTIVGSFMLPNEPNTNKIHIHGAGVNEMGQRVAYILGERSVEKPNPLGPDFPPSINSEEFWMEIPIGDDVEGVGSDVYKEIRQNHPKMFDAIESDRARVVDSAARSLREPKPKQEPDIPDAQQAQIDRYNELKRLQKEAEQRAVGRRIQQGVMPGEARSASILSSTSANNEAKQIQEEMDALLNDPVVGNLIRKQEGRPETFTSANIFESFRDTNSPRSTSEDPIREFESMQKESAEVIARIPDEMKDRVTEKINEALPQKIYAFETENSQGRKLLVSKTKLERIQGK